MARPRLKKRERGGPLKTKSGITKAAVNVMTMSDAEKKAARKKRAARTAAVKAGAKKKAAPANQRGRVTPAAKKLIKKGAKASKPKPKKSMVGRDAKPPQRSWKARKRTT